MFSKGLKTLMKKTLKIGCKVTCEPGFQYVTDADIITAATKQRNVEEKETVISLVIAWHCCVLTLC
jgi:hypothetical protein